MAWLSEGGDHGCIFRQTELRERVRARGGAVGQQLVRGDWKCSLLCTLTGVKALGVDTEQEPYSVLHAKSSSCSCKRHLRSFLLSIPLLVNIHAHTHAHAHLLSPFQAPSDL